MSGSGSTYSALPTATGGVLNQVCEYSTATAPHLSSPPCDVSLQADLAMKLTFRRNYKIESHVLHFERCPACAKVGNDRSGDNLAVYSDGHTYCFNCGYGNRSTKITLHKKDIVVDDTRSLYLPNDVTTELPYEARDWLNQYELNRRDILKHNILWSPWWSRIIFPIFDSTGLIAWQGRYIGTEQTSYQGQKNKPAKWYSKGDIHQIIHPIQVTNGFAILVEDIVSAIKLGNVCGAIPIFGSTLSPQMVVRLKNVVSEIKIWLDPDMRSKSIKYTQLCSVIGLPATVVLSDKDPKEHSYIEIDKILNQE